MNHRFFVSLFLFAITATGFSACAVQQLSERSDVTIHSVHSLNFGGTAAIVGIVADSAGHFLAGASVALFDVVTESLKIEAEVQPDGTYEIAGISPGKYRLRAKADGFTIVQVKDLNLRTNTLAVIDFRPNRTN